MNFFGKFLSNFKDFYNEINSATLTGAIDVIVIQQPDGTYQCSPFHVRFGKIGVLRSREKVVDIEINGNPVNIHMKLGESGEAFFVEEVEGEYEIPLHLATSPLPSVPDLELEVMRMKMKNAINERTLTHSVSADNAKHQHKEEQSNPSQNFVRQDLKSSEEEMEHIMHAEKSDHDSLLNEVTADPSAPDYKMKRKKRRKLCSKKRAKSREIGIPNNSVTCEISVDRTALDVVNTGEKKDSDVDSLEQPEEIFQMDDDYGETEEDEGYDGPNGLIRSISLPLNANKALAGEWPARKMSSTFTGEFHPFSDGDVTPHSSPPDSRPPSPKSDTEYENQKQEALNQDTDGPSWDWGELPNVPSRKVSTVQNSNHDTNCTTINAEDVLKVEEDTNESDKRSMLGGMLNFMRSTKKLRHMPQSEGIYLDSLDADTLDPDVAALYFPKFSRTDQPEKTEHTIVEINDEDQDSGKGLSLPHSPPSNENPMEGTNSLDCDMYDLHDTFVNIAMSLCGGLQDCETEFPEERFTSALVTYEQFTENPSMLTNPNLVLRLGSKYFNWQTAAPMLISMVAFQRLLPEKTTNQLINEHMPKKKKSKYTSWWTWRRSDDTDSKTETTSDVNAPSIESNNSENKDALLTQPLSLQLYDWDEKINSSVEMSKCSNSETLLEAKNETEAVVVDMNADQNLNTEVESASLNVINETEVTVTQSSDVESSLRNSPVSFEQATIKTDSLSVPETSPTLTLNESKENVNDVQEKPKEKCKKSLRLTSEQIESLNLLNGPNEVVFSVTTAYQGTTRCKCDIYLWRYDDKIVISDIDGTITKSDVLGHILPMVGRDWAQLGVAKLFTKVKNNGYQFLYLSARAIGQARITRDYLRSVRQGEVCLPDGPLLLSPTSLISALHREVIEKKPEEFKISCLKDVQTLFPPDMGNPFFAGFGNKINDTWAYCTVGIPKTRVFTINHKGELKLEFSQPFHTSYSGMSDQVDHTFPPLGNGREINGRLAPSFTSNEEFSYFSYWREPISSFNPDDLLE